MLPTVRNWFEVVTPLTLLGFDTATEAQTLGFSEVASIETLQSLIMSTPAGTFTVHPAELAVDSVTVSSALAAIRLPPADFALTVTTFLNPLIDDRQSRRTFVEVLALRS